MIDLSPSLLSLLTLLTILVPIFHFFWKIRGDVRKISERQAADFESIRIALDSLSESSRDARVLLADVTKENTLALKELRAFLKNRFEMEDRLALLLQSVERREKEG